MPDSSDTAGLGRRKTPRLRLIAEARLVTRNGTYRARVDNVSEAGAHLTLANSEPFTWCILKWAKRELSGVMVWSERNAFGIRFDTPLAAEVVLAFKEQFPAIYENEKLPVPNRWRKL